MKKRYGIGFLIGMIVFTLVLVCAYQLSYDRAMRKLEVKQKIDSEKAGKRNRDKRICSKRRRVFYQRERRLYYRIFIR